MARKKTGDSNAYAHRILHAIARAQSRQNSSRYPVDMGEITKIGPEDEDIVISLSNSLVSLTGDEVQWMIDEERLRVGDIVTVVFDLAGDPMVVAAVLDADLTEGLESPTAAESASHTHREEVAIPTSPQSTFYLSTGFDAAQVYVNGSRWLEDVHYTITSPKIDLATFVQASTIVQFDLRIEP